MMKHWYRRGSRWLLVGGGIVAAAAMHLEWGLVMFAVVALAVGDSAGR